MAASSASSGAACGRKAWDCEAHKSMCNGNLDGTVKQTCFDYPDIWPMNCVARQVAYVKVPNLTTGGCNDPCRRTINIPDMNWGQVIGSLALAVFLTFVAGYFFTIFYGASKAVFDPLVATVPPLAALAPLVYGLARALAYYAIYSMVFRINGGLICFWDLLAFAAYGWIGRDVRKSFDWMAYGWNWVMAALYGCALFLGSYLGGLTVNLFVQGSRTLGCAVPEFSMVEREGPLILLFIVSTAVFVFLRMYWGNPFVAQQPTSAAVFSTAVGVIGVVGGYIGSTGAWDLFAPLGLGLVHLKFEEFWTLIVGQLAGAFLGAVLFLAALLFHGLIKEPSEKVATD